MKHNLKMYILLRDEVPDHFAPNCAAHASLACYLKFKDHPDTQEWVEGSFRKVTCRVNDKEYAGAEEAGDFVTLSESGLDGMEVIKVFRPRIEWPKRFNYFRLWKPAQ